MRGAKSNNTAIRKSKRNFAMVTEGNVTRKPNASTSSLPGLKPAKDEEYRSKSLNLAPINREKDKYEYYTSEDEFGLPVNKLRVKGSKSANRKKSKSPRKGSKQKRNRSRSPGKESRQGRNKINSSVDAKISPRKKKQSPKKLNKSPRKKNKSPPARKE